MLLALNPDGSLTWFYLGRGEGSEGFAAHPSIGNDGTIYFGAGTRFMPST